MIFAVITVGSVFIYDTQHPFPLVKFSGLHYAAINDAAWSGDGKFFTFCSSDGYVTIVRMDEGILGEFLEAEKVPETVKASHCCLYDYVPPVVVPAPAEATPAKNGKGSATPKSDSKKSEEKEVEKEDNKEDGKVEVSEPAEEKKSSDADLLSPSKQTKPTEAPTTPMRPVMDANSSDADNSAKKRKRIQPVVIAALGSLSGNTSNICKPSTPAADQSNSSSSASSSSSSSSSAAVTVHHHSNQAAVVSVVEDGKQMSSVTQEIESKQQSEEKKEEGSATKKKRIAPVLLSPTLP